MLRFLSVLLLLPMLAGCGEDPAAPDTSHVGTYHLVSVDGALVPVSFEEEGETFTVLDGSVTLNADGTFAFAAEFVITADGGATPGTDALAGTYTKSENNVTFTHTGVDVGFETATIVGGVLTTQGGGGEVLVFER